MIESVLVANRGEIACRIIRTAKRLGIRTIAIYSDADAFSLVTHMADEAYRIGPSPALESYLNIQKILKIAKEVNVAAIHPGYGFLSENEAFARACSQAGIIFIGPSVEVLHKMGSKSQAKMLAHKAGLPIIPGYQGNQHHLSKKADEIGYPLMIKAVMGGGGKGMRHVRSKNMFQKALKACQREATLSFGNDEVLIEKYISSPRHIEVQIFGDRHGNLVHLFERDCSLQRRHQKVIEEGPSSLPLDLKEKIYRAAFKLGEMIQYEGAGTVEFLVDEKGNFYFMEMNTRLQVEHGVTEELTGIDLVEWQFRVASNEKLPFSQKEIISHGHAFELRLYAEDPQHDFQPITGNIWMNEIPQNARIETGLQTFDTISPYYDPLVAKVIVKGETRDEALQKANLALNDLKILGVKTNASFLKNLLHHKDIRENNFDVGFIDRHLSLLAPQKNIPENVYLAASLIKALSHLNHTFSPWSERHSWRIEGYAPLSFEWICDGEIKTILLTYSPKSSTSWIASAPSEPRNACPRESGEPFSVPRVKPRAKDCERSEATQETWAYEPLGTFQAHFTQNILTFLNLRIPFWEMEDKISLFYQGETFTLTPAVPLIISSIKEKNENHLKAPMTGKIISVLVSAGEHVKENEPLLILEAMKMEHIISSPEKGIVKQIFYHLGDIVTEGVHLIDIQKDRYSYDVPKES